MTLDCSKRHVNRMLKAYKEQGRAFFIHGNRGRQPSTTIPEATRNAVVSLYRTKYYDANFQHYSELLATHENIHISASSVAKILESHCILSPKATKAKKKRMKKNWQKRRNVPKHRKRPIPYRQISLPWRTLIPDVPDALILANWSRWMPLLMNGSPDRSGISIWRWTMPPGQVTGCLFWYTRNAQRILPCALPDAAQLWYPL